MWHYICLLVGISHFHTYCSGIYFCIWWLLCIGHSNPAHMLRFYKSDLFSVTWAASDRQGEQDEVTDPGPHVIAALGIWWEISKYYNISRVICTHTHLYIYIFIHLYIHIYNLQSVLGCKIFYANNTLTICNCKNIKWQISCILNSVVLLLCIIKGFSDFRCLCRYRGDPVSNYPGCVSRREGHYQLQVQSEPFIQYNTKESLELVPAETRAIS